MEPNVGINVKCESNCFQWCPRKSSCCSKEYDSDRSDEVIKSADKVAKVALKNSEDKKKKFCIIM